MKELARSLRNKSTPGEIELWKKLSGKQMLGYDFHRQKPVGNYIIDLYCPALMLAIEIDGISHENDEAHQKDEVRQKDLESFGITFLRFKESDVMHNLRGVMKQIEWWIRGTHPSPLSPNHGHTHRGENV